MYIVVQNPVVTKTDENGEVVPVFDKHGQAVLRTGESEIRLETSEPFPFYPGEMMVHTDIQPTPKNTLFIRLGGQIETIDRGRGGISTCAEGIEGLYVINT